MLALAYEQLRQKPGAVAEYKWILKAYPKLNKKDQDAGGARVAGAHAAFALLEPEFKAYKKMKITLRKKTLIATH